MLLIKKIIFKSLFELYNSKSALLIFFKKLKFKNTNIIKLRKSLGFIYNLDVQPITFDFIEILCQAEIFRRKKKLPYLDIIFIYHSKAKFVLKPTYGDYSKFVKNHDYKTRFNEIILQSTRLFKSVKNIHIVDRYSSKNIINNYIFKYPSNYKSGIINQIHYNTPNQKNFFPLIESGKTEIDFIKKYLKNNQINKKVITISIRDYPYLKLRNSNLNSWLKFAKKYQHKFEFIFISDNSNLKDYKILKKNKFKVLDIISWSLPLRAALYKVAFLNMAVGSGPIHLSLFQEGCKTLMFLKNHQKLVKIGYMKTINDYYNLEIGKNRSFLDKYNKYIWKNDSFKEIDFEFQKLLEEIK